MNELRPHRDEKCLNLLQSITLKMIQRKILVILRVRLIPKLKSFRVKLWKQKAKLQTDELTFSVFFQKYISTLLLNF